MATRTPPIYATGQWKVIAPFTVDSQTTYTCKAVRSIEDLEARGVDPFTSFYQPYDITKADYDNDVKNLVNIVTLMSPTAATLYIPDTYIASYPDTTMMPYSHVVISASLGAVPDTLTLDDTLERVNEVVKESTGIDTQARVHIAGVMTQGVDFTTHLSLENQRLQRIKDNQSLYAQLNEKDNRIQQLNQQIQLLEEIIVDNGLLE